MIKFMKKPFILLIAICLFCGFLFQNTVHADEEDKISVKYTIDGSSEEIEANLTSIGTGVTRGDYTGHAYLATLPSDGVIKSVTKAGYTVSYGSTVNTLFTAFNTSLEDLLAKPDLWYVDEEFDINTENIVYEGDGDITRRSYSLWVTYSRIADEVQSEIPMENVRGFIARLINNDTQGEDYVIIQVSTASAVVDKTALKELIDNAYTSGFYTENDTWNGKDGSENGFWSDYQAILGEANQVYESTSYTQEQIDAKVEEFTTRLNNAIANLIPDTQVLPVKIHNALRTYKPLSDEDKAKHSAKSVQKYENTRSAAVAAYDTLFDGDGNAIVETNKAERQEEIDAVADALEAAYNDLLGKSSETDIERWFAASEWVASQTIVEDHFTAESVDALNSAIQAAKAIEDAYDDPHDILASKTEYQAYTDAVASALCAYYQLENAGPISVHVRIVDNYGILHPEYAIDDSGDSDMAHFNGNVTLTNNKTIQGLFLENEGGLYTLPKTAYTPRTGAGGIDDTCEHAHTYVYVNGKLAIPALQADPTSLARMNPSAGHMDIYSGKDLSVGGYYPSDGIYENIEDRFPVLKNALHDGDDVVVLRTSAPYMHYYQTGVLDRCLSNNSDGSRHVPLSAYYDSFGFLNIDDSAFTEGAVEAKPEEGIEISVSQSQSDVITGDPSDTEEAKNISVFASEPFESKEAAEKASSFTALTAKDGDDTVDVVTDADGKAEFSLAKEGWYRIAVMGIKGEMRVQNSFTGSEILGGYYPSLKVSDYMLVHISLDDEREDVALAKEAAENAEGAAADAKAAYEASKEAADAAAATPGDEAVAAADKALEDAETAAEKAEEAKAAADAYLAKVQALEAKKDQMSDANKAAIEAELTNAEKMVSDASDAKDAADAEVKKAEDAQDKAVTKAALKACQEEIAQLKADIVTKQQEIDALKTQNTANQTKISELEREIAAAQEELETLLGDEENQGRIAELNEQIETAQNTIDNLTQQIIDNQTEINTLKEEVVAAKGEIESLTNLASAKKDAINRINKYLDDNKGNILPEDSDSAELAVLRAIMAIKDASTEEEITKAADAAIAKLDEKIAVKKAVDKAKAQTVSDLKVKVKKNTATITWKKNAEVTGYEVFRSLKKKSGYKKVSTLSKNTKTKFVNKKLKKGKKYFYKVRTFTKVNGKKYYGKYTAVKATKKIK